MDAHLLKKYNIQGPRYTSYPTVPYWDAQAPTEAAWQACVKSTFEQTNNSEGISLYIHLPYCESLCTYCGCNTRITRNHAVETPYIDTLLREWGMYKVLFTSKPIIKEIHLGGGTPTFFSANNLRKLINGLLLDCDRHPDYEFSIEGHPNHTSREQLETLYDLGFRRISFGIQDFDPVVQEIVNRVQTFETVKQVTELARAIGYTSVNYDLIYGLPLQTQTSVSDTINKVRALRPDRIAFYSYAHVPWVKPGQRKFTELDLPEGEGKRALYELGRQMLEDAGYIEIGMDHFALPHDELFAAAEQGRLHRNFMGYTTGKTSLLIGLGASSISDATTAFAQNLKKVEDYAQAIQSGHLPIFKGHLLNTEDLLIRNQILDVMCRLSTDIEPSIFPAVRSRLQELLDDALILLTDKHLQVTPQGKAFLRNISMAFDMRLWDKQPATQVFSQAV